MFNRFFKKQEPEKPKPNFIGEQHEHKACLVLFDGTKAIKHVEQLKAQYQKCTVVKAKTTDRIKTMIKECEKISYHQHQLQTSSLTSLNIASNYSEIIAMQMGLVETNEMQGFAICPGCLHQAIVACEEVLNSLKDIQEATKDWV